MSKPIILILDYIAFTLLGLLGGLFLFSQYFNAISLVAGKNTVFSAEILVYGVFFILPIIFITISMFLAFYKIRHLSSPVSSCITYSILSAFTWFIMYPATLMIQEKVLPMVTPIEQLENKQELSGGYFRKINGTIYYFIHDTKNDSANVVRLYDSKAPNDFAKVGTISVSTNSEFAAFSGNFHDPIIKESMEKTPYNISKIFDFYKMKAERTWNIGIIAWLFFCSLGLALGSVYGLIRISSWKLLNSFWILIMSCMIIWFNFFYYQPVFSTIRTAINRFLFDPSKLNFFIENEIELPLFAVNILVSIIMILIGILRTVSNKNRSF